jgi:hypothetical protein
MYIKQKLKHTSSKIKNLFKYFYYTQRSLEPNLDAKTAVVHLSGSLLNKDMGRYAFIICQMLKFSGFQLVVKVDPDFFNNAPYKNMLRKQGFEFVRSTSLKPDSISFHGHDLRKKVISLIFGDGLPEHKVEAYHLPYPLHPRFYGTHLNNSDFDVYRKQKRTTRIIFSGNFDRKLYSKPILKERFPGTISRVEALDHISAKHAEDSRILRTATKEDLYRRLGSKPEVREFIISEARTPDEDWLSILSKGDFYLCLPGVGMPWSHNAIETMALGTIPILQYNELFYPPLEHLKNCISYSSYDSLDEAIQMALTMSEEQVKEMKEAVIKYHDQYLATSQTLDRIQSFVQSDEESMFLTLPFLEKNKRIELSL